MKMLAAFGWLGQKRGSVCQVQTTDRKTSGAGSTRRRARQRAEPALHVALARASGSYSTSDMEVQRYITGDLGVGRYTSATGGRRYSSTLMFFFRQISLSCFGQTVTLTSPRCALRSRSIVVRDWPMPPPIDSGIWSFRIAW